MIGKAESALHLETLGTQGNIGVLGSLTPADGFAIHLSQPLIQICHFHYQKLNCHEDPMRVLLNACYYGVVWSRLVDEFFVQELVDGVLLVLVMSSVIGFMKYFSNS